MKPHRPHVCRRCGGTGHNRQTCTGPVPVWWKALKAREASRTPGMRHHPVAKVGDKFGPARVIALLPRTYDSNERVRVRCEPCGTESDAYVFNLRKRSKTCTHRQRCRHCGETTVGRFCSNCGAPTAERAMGLP